VTEQTHGAMALGYSTDWEVRHCEFKGWRGKGIVTSSYLAPGANGPRTARFVINDNLFHKFGHGNAIGIGYGADDFAITNNRIYDNYTPGASESLLLISNDFHRGLFANNQTANWGNFTFQELYDSL